MCRNKAEWTIVYGRGPEDATEACTKHVGDLLTDAVHQIYPFSNGQAWCCFISWWERIWLTLTSSEYREATRAHS